MSDVTVPREDMPLLLGITFNYTDDGTVISTVEYIESRDKHEQGQMVRSLTFTSKLGEHIETAVDEFQYNMVRLIDAVNEALRQPPPTIPSRKVRALSDD